MTAGHDQHNQCNIASIGDSRQAMGKNVDREVYAQIPELLAVLSRFGCNYRHFLNFHQIFFISDFSRFSLILRLKTVYINIRETFRIHRLLTLYNRCVSAVVLASCGRSLIRMN